jgi:hypothetical protein
VFAGGRTEFFGFGCCARVGRKLLYIFVDSAHCTIVWMVSLHRTNLKRSDFFSLGLLSKKSTSALDTPGAMVAIGLGMSLSLAFTALWYVLLCSWRFEFHFGVV